MRLRAGSTAENLSFDQAVKVAAALAAPVGHDGPPRPGTHPQPKAVHAGSAPIIGLEGPFALGHGVLLVVSDVCLRHPAARASHASWSAVGRGGYCYWSARSPTEHRCGSQPYRRLSGDCLRVLTGVRWVKPGLPQRTLHAPTSRALESPNWNATELLAAARKTVSFGQCRFSPERRSTTK